MFRLLFLLKKLVLFASGTPPGVGCFIKPEPIFLKDGDVVEVEIDEIGTISNQVLLPRVIMLYLFRFSHVLCYCVWPGRGWSEADGWQVQVVSTSAYCWLYVHVEAMRVCLGYMLHELAFTRHIHIHKSGHWSPLWFSYYLGVSEKLHFMDIWLWQWLWDVWRLKSDWQWQVAACDSDKKINYACGMHKAGWMEMEMEAAGGWGWGGDGFAFWSWGFENRFGFS